MAHSASRLFSGVDFDAAQLFDTSDPEEASALAGRILSPHSIQASGRGFRSRMAHLTLGRLSLSRLTWGAAVRVDPGALGSYYLLALPLKGRACFHIDGRAIEVSPREPALISPGQRFRFDARGDYAQVVVRIELRSMEHGYQALTGRACRASLNFTPQLSTAGTSWRAVEPLLQVLAGRALPAGSAVPAFEHRIEELLVATLLLHQPHTLSERLLPARSSGVSRHARLAQAYMLDHLEEALTVGQVAIAVGVSVRTLQTAFNTLHGFGPMQWLREQRLRRVREVLCTGGEASITDIAMRNGFTHLGEFSRAYRRMFGETASDSRSNGG
jgi:AraC-like DNA-binding protein